MYNQEEVCIFPDMELLGQKEQDVEERLTLDEIMTLAGQLT